MARGTWDKRASVKDLKNKLGISKMAQNLENSTYMIL